MIRNYLIICELSHILLSLSSLSRNWGLLQPLNKKMEFCAMDFCRDEANGYGFSILSLERVIRLLTAGWRLRPSHRPLMFFRVTKRALLNGWFEVGGSSWHIEKQSLYFMVTWWCKPQSRWLCSIVIQPVYLITHSSL